MQVLTDSNNNPIWLFMDASFTASTSIGIGPVGKPYNGAQTSGNLNPGYYWVPLPMQVPQTIGFASWTDWLEWDVENSQLWWGKDIAMQSLGQQTLNEGDGNWWLFYYQEF